jgi:transposase
MSVLDIEDTSIDGTNVTVTAIVEDMRLLYRASRFEPEEWAPALCSARFELVDGEQIPVDEDGFCSYLDSLNLDWQLVDTSDWDLD